MLVLNVIRRMVCGVTPAIFSTRGVACACTAAVIPPAYPHCVPAVVGACFDHAPRPQTPDPEAAMKPLATLRRLQAVLALAMVAACATTSPGREGGEGEDAP